MLSDGFFAQVIPCRWTSAGAWAGQMASGLVLQRGTGLVPVGPHLDRDVSCYAASAGEVGDSRASSTPSDFLLEGGGDGCRARDLGSPRRARSCRTFTPFVGGVVFG